MSEQREKRTPGVLNFYACGKTVPEGAVYIGRGRGGPWGNPFVIGEHGTRDEVIAKYRAWLNDSQELIELAKRELAGKDLVCFCAPRACHGDILIAIANGTV